MKRVEAIDVMKKYLDIKQSSEVIMAHNMAIEALEKQMHDEWIPCSERLPEDDKYILISFENFSVPVVGRYEEDETGGAFYIGDEDETCIQQDMIVNAWRPLPEPYREVE